MLLYYLYTIYTEARQVNAIFNFKLVRTRILLVFSVLLFFIVCFILYTYVTNQSIKSSVANITDGNVQLAASQQLVVTMAVRENAALKYVTTGDEVYKQTFLDYNDEAARVSALLTKSEEQAQLVEKAIAWSMIVEREIFTLYEQGKVQEAMALLQANRSMSEEVRVGYEALGAEQSERMEQVSQRVSETVGSTSLRSGVFGLVVLLIGILMAFYTASFISTPIKVVTERVKRLAAGDLTQESAEVNRLDELGQLFNATTNLTINLRQTLSAVNTVSSHVATNSEELAQSSAEVKLGTDQASVATQQLAVGAELQAQKSVELSTTMQQFTANIQEATAEGLALKTNSSNAQQLAHDGKALMAQSTEQMAAINQIMQDAVSKVEGLYDQSKEITQLVQVIEAIANQTNLLALNAAIEAARAGEHGKGFAVVADEVRQLAEQVNHSVTNISTIVGRMQKETGSVRQSLQQGYTEVQLGTEKISTTSVTFEGILGAIDQLTESVDTISSALSHIVTRTESIHASIEESVAVSEQAAAGVEQTSTTIQQTASTMEGISQSAEVLATMAEDLNGQLEKFKL